MKKQILFLTSMILFILMFSSCEQHDLTEEGLLVPLTVDQDTSLPSIAISNTMLHAETFGDASDPIIIAIHGGPGGDYRSILNCKNLANDGYYVVFYDQRGSGLSQRHDAAVFNTQQFINDLGEVIDYYRQDENQKVILMGHSWGAMLAAAYVNQNPTLINGLILMEPGGLTWEDTEDYIMRALPLEPFDEASNDFVYMDQFLTSSDHEVLDYKSGLNSASSFYKGNKTGNASMVPFWRFGYICNKAIFDYVVDHPFDFTTNLDQYTSKVLFVYSELNEAYGLEHAQLVSSPFSNVDLVKIDGTGHEIPYFGWANLYPLVQSYLNTIN